ncbi:MAG: EAL domain-containing protein [Rhodocyclaceae bacterium]|nr:EAL domain-containing protein [Rhodocyclaceae bacterium]
MQLSRVIRRLSLACLLCLTTAFAAPPDAPPEHHVLMIFSGQRDAPVERMIERGLREVLETESGDRRIRISSAYLDMFDGYDPEMGRLDADRLGRRLATKGQPDLIVTVTAVAARFLAEHRATFPEDVRIASIAPPAATLRLRGPHTRTFTNRVQVWDTIQLARELLPEATRAVVIAGDGGPDRLILAAARRQVADAPDAFPVSFLTDFSRESLLAQVAALPSDTILVMTAATRDIDGVPLVPPAAFADEVAAHASVPMFCVYEGTITYASCVGGIVNMGRGLGRAVGQQVLDMLAGHGPFEPVSMIPGRAVFKGTAMDRWDMDEADLPEGIEIVEATLSVYQRYKEAIWTALGVISAQALSIFALVMALRNSRRNRRRIREFQKRWKFALESAGHGVWDWDIQRDEHFFSSGWCDMLGLPASEERNLARDGLIHPDDLADVHARVAHALASAEGSFQSEHRIRHADGHTLWVLERGRVVERDRDGEARRLVATLEDVTARREAAEQIEYMATHDALTGLPNRTLLADRIERAISRARREHHKVAVIFMDLDHFKQVNDTLGHHVGDMLLIAVAGRMMPHLREADTVSRQGGDEFVILLPELQEPGDAARVCEKLLRELDEPVQFDGHDLRISASMGVAFFPDDGPDRESLLQKADVALYRVKDSGRRGYRFFSAEMNAELTDRRDLENRLSSALAAGHFSVWYQPQFDLQTGALSGAEALLRWIEPDGTTISPARFIPVAEQFGHIHELGEFALRTACTEAQRWNDGSGPELPVAVNLSAVQFRRPGLTDSVARVLAETGLPPRLLVLEITESVIMEDEALTRDTLRALAATGARLAIDDFGTGYSSLAYLKRFPVHHLKIDRAFIKDLGRDPDDEVIVRTIVQLGHSLGLQIVAEGVETESQAVILQRHGCEFVQGFLYGRPQPARDFQRLLGNVAPVDA